MNSCFPPLAALSLKDNKNLAPSDNMKIKKKSYWGSNNSLRKLSTSNCKDRSSTPIATPTGNSKLDILQDLDLYYIKQIAHNLKEFDLEQKIDLEIKMREGTTKLLAACKHQTQSLEAAKNLLISNERMSAYMTELQKRKRDSSRTLGGYSKGRLSLSDLRIPLIWRDIDHFKNKGDYRRFAVFCLVKVDTEMYDTSLLCPVDRSLTDLTFPDVLLFNKVNPDFSLKLEVYSHMLQDDLSIASAPRRIKNTIHTSISRTVGKKLAATLRDELNAGKVGPNFELMATASLSLDEAYECVRTHDLKVENTEAGRNQLPLFGHFCCRLAAQPNCMVQEMYSGYLNLLSKNQKTKSKQTENKSWVRCWACLQAFKLKLWSHYEQYLDNQEPLAEVTVNRDTVIMAKRNLSLEIEISNEYDGGKNTVLQAESSEDRAKWFRYLTQHVTDHLRWKRAAEKFMEVQSLDLARNSYVKSARHGSLYEQTPINEYDCQPKRYNGSPASDIFGLTNTSIFGSLSSSGSSSSFRERSLSTNATTEQRPRRSSYWSFSKNNNR